MKLMDQHRFAALPKNGVVIVKIERLRRDHRLDVGRPVLGSRGEIVIPIRRDAKRRFGEALGPVAASVEPVDNLFGSCRTARN